MFSFRLWIFLLVITENDAEAKTHQNMRNATLLPSSPLPALHRPRTN